MTDEQFVEFVQDGKARGLTVEAMLDGAFGKTLCKFKGAHITRDEEGKLFADCTVEDSTGKVWSVHHRHLVSVRS